MFINKFNYQEIPYRNYKSLKFLYQSFVLKTCFLKNKYILFFYYDIMSIEKQNLLKKSLIQENLKYYKIKRNIFKKYLNNSEINIFNNLIINNILIIYNFLDLESEFNYLNLLKILTFKDLHFLGIWFNNQFLRPSELKKWFVLYKINPIKKTIQLLKLNIFQIKKYLILKINK